MQFPFCKCSELSQTDFNNLHFTQVRHDNSTDYFLGELYSTTIMTATHWYIQKMLKGIRLMCRPAVVNVNLPKCFA